MIENCISSGEKKTVRLCFTSDEAHRCLSVIRQRRRSIVQKKKKSYPMPTHAIGVVIETSVSVRAAVIDFPCSHQS